MASSIAAQHMIACKAPCQVAIGKYYAYGLNASTSRRVHQMRREQQSGQKMPYLSCHQVVLHYKKIITIMLFNLLLLSQLSTS